MTTKVRVLPRFTLCYRGRVYQAGETVDVSDDAAAGWHAWGSVTPEPHPKKTSGAKRLGSGKRDGG
jgi:hypothetical protein